MKISKELAPLATELAGAERDYQALIGHFANFCETARILAEEDPTALKGKLKVTKADGTTLKVSFIDRSWVIRLRYDGNTSRGLLQVIDTTASIEAAQKLIMHVSFGIDGETDLDNGMYGKVSLGVPRDCKTLFLQIVADALRHNP
jgi:hypothetical protein